MNSNKKSFLLHIDSLAVLEDLTDEQAGQLFKAISAYQKNEDLTLNQFVKIAFSPFKNQFIRDNERYDITCKRRAEAGSAGGKAKASKTKQMLANATEAKQKVANLADSNNKNKNKNKSNNKNNKNSDNETTGQSEIDHLFESFWCSGIRKVNKKKALSLFSNIIKRQSDKSEFTDNLINDVNSRISANQLGFAEMHPTTYLNGERWNDDQPQAPKSAAQIKSESRQAVIAQMSSEMSGRVIDQDMSSHDDYFNGQTLEHKP